MGGWISVALASKERYRERISGLLLVAPSLNFIRPYYQDLVSRLPQQGKDALDKGEVGPVVSSGGQWSVYRFGRSSIMVGKCC